MRSGTGSVRVKAGNQVIFTATVSGNTVTGVRAIDVSLIQQGFQRFFAHAPGGNFKMVAP